MIRFLFVSAVATAVFTTFATGPALAANRQVTIVNGTTNSMVRFYAANSGRSDGQEDVLGDRILKPGQSVRVDIDDGSGACVYDFRAEFDNGETLARPKIDVCEITTYRYTAK